MIGSVKTQYPFCALDEIEDQDLLGINRPDFEKLFNNILPWNKENIENLIAILPSGEFAKMKKNDVAIRIRNSLYGMVFEYVLNKFDFSKGHKNIEIYTQYNFKLKLKIAELVSDGDRHELIIPLTKREVKTKEIT